MAMSIRKPFRSEILEHGVRQDTALGHVNGATTQPGVDTITYEYKAIAPSVGERECGRRPPVRLCKHEDEKGSQKIDSDQWDGFDGVSETTLDRGHLELIQRSAKLNMPAKVSASW